MKRAVYVMLALAAVLLLALPFTRQAVYVSAAQLQERLSAAAEADNMEQKDEAQLCALLQIRNDAYEEAVYFGAPSYMDVEEIILLWNSRPGDR